MQPRAATSRAPSTRSGPLAGFRVLDLGTFIAAPFCATLFAEFGADVVKVEMPGRGDSLRTLGDDSDGVGLLWLQESRNKRVITCDLRRPEGQEIIRELVGAGFDIVVENFRPGTLERWNIGFDELAATNVGVILARISGYGQTGPARSKPGFGRIAQAFGGLTYLCGFPDRPPANPGSATIADYLAGLFAAFGIFVARERRLRTGRGQTIDVALCEGIFRILDSLAITYSVKGDVRERTGTATALAAPHNHFSTADGKWIAIACTNDKIFGRLADAMAQPDLANDERFANERARVANRTEIDALVSEWTGSYPLGVVVEEFDVAEVPCSPIYSIADAFADPQYVERESLMTFNDPQAGPVSMPTVVPRLDESPGMIEWLGPRLGEHTDELLRRYLGYSDEKLADLRAAAIL